MRITLRDVRRAGSVSAAIEAECESSDSVAAATPAALSGQTFATSGPGPGWSRQFDANDYAARALADGAVSAIDPDDGREATLADGEVDWSDESVIELVCPSIEDAVDDPATVAIMVQAVIDHHHAASDCGEWRRLIEAMRAAAAALDDIDLDDLPA